MQRPIWVGLALYALCLNATTTAVAAVPDKNWDDCSQAVGHDRAVANKVIDACTIVLRRGERKSAERRADAFNARGVAYLANGAPVTAVDDFDAAIKLSPRNKLFYYNRGVTHLRTGVSDFGLAISDLNESTRLDRLYILPYIARGFAYLERPNPMLAEKEFAIALRLNSQNTDAQAGVKKARAVLATRNTAFNFAIEYFIGFYSIAKMIQVIL